MNQLVTGVLNESKVFVLSTMVVRGTGKVVGVDDLLLILWVRLLAGTDATVGVLLGMVVAVSVVDVTKDDVVVCSAV